MQYTPNYNMTIAEGTDVVNPLTQIFPNFEEIDTQMYANKNAGIGTATEVTTGTVHAITRANTSCPVIRYTATSDWAAGDTMTIDGVSVTVHMSDGKIAPDDAYKIGAEVFGILNGTLFTLITSAGAARAYVEVTGDGVKTYGDIMNELFALIDFTKVTDGCILVDDKGTYSAPLQLTKRASNELKFSRTEQTATVTYSDSYDLMSGASVWYRGGISSSYSASDMSATVKANGTTLRLYY